LEHKNARKRLIYSLIIFTLALIIANVFMSSVNPNNPAQKKVSTSIKQIDSAFQSVLKQFEIEDSWQKKIKVNQRLFDSLKIKHKISLPLEITTIEFLAELNGSINYDDVLLKATEEKINGNCEIKIYAEGTLKYWAILNRDVEIKRNNGSFIFLLSNLSKLSSDQFVELFNSPFPFGVLFQPSSENKVVKTACSNSKKEYCILLDDEISEDIFKLDPNFTKSRLKNSVINIINNFGGAINFYIDRKSEIFNSTSYSYVREEFKKRGKELNIFNNLNKLESDSKEDLKSLFDFYYASIAKNEVKLLLTKAENYFVLQSQIIQITKKGFNILFPSQSET